MLDLNIIHMNFYVKKKVLTECSKVILEKSWGRLVMLIHLLMYSLLELSWLVNYFFVFSNLSKLVCTFVFKYFFDCGFVVSSMSSFLFANELFFNFLKIEH